MKRFLFLMTTAIPSFVLCASLFGSLSMKASLTVWVAIATGYIWGITAPSHMHRPQDR